MEFNSDRMFFVNSDASDIDFINAEEFIVDMGITFTFLPKAVPTSIKEKIITTATGVPAAACDKSSSLKQFNLTTDQLAELSKINVQQDLDAS